MPESCNYEWRLSKVFAGEEADVVATSFKAALVLTEADALAVAGELLTVATAQLKAKG